MTVYRVIDNATICMTTFDELKALRKLRAIMEKYKVSWGWVESDEVE